MSSFGKTLKGTRVGSGKTLREVSEYLGVSISYLSDIENERKKAPNLELVMKIEEFLCVTNNALVNVASEERKRVPTEVLREAQKNPQFTEILMWLIKMDKTDLEKALQSVKEIRQSENEYCGTT